MVTWLNALMKFDVYFFCLFFTVTCVSVNAQKTVKGFYVTTNQDTVFCLMLKFKGFKEETNTFREIQIINNSGTFRTLYPDALYSYAKENVFYRSTVFRGKGVFVKLLVQGKVSLYYYSDENQNGYYIFKRDDENDYMVMDYTFHVSKIVGPNPNMSERSSSSGLLIRPKDETFAHFFSQYFKDCEPVVRKIKTEFYTKDDMTDIFKDYNKFYKTLN